VGEVGGFSLHAGVATKANEYLIGPNPEIVGRAISSFSMVQSRETARFVRPKYRPDPPKTARVQAYIEGSITNQFDHYDVENTKIAIALNGTA